MNPHNVNILGKKGYTKEGLCYFCHGKNGYKPKLLLYLYLIIFSANLVQDLKGPIWAPNRHNIKKHAAFRNINQIKIKNKKYNEIKKASASASAFSQVKNYENWFFKDNNIIH